MQNTSELCIGYQIWFREHATEEIRINSSESLNDLVTTFCN